MGNNVQIFSFGYSVADENIYIFAAAKGGLAQLARAFDWQSKGHRFDSGNLHKKGWIIYPVFFVSNLPSFSQTCGNNTDDKNLHGMKNHQR